MVRSDFPIREVWPRLVCRCAASIVSRAVQKGEEEERE